MSSIGDLSKAGAKQMDALRKQQERELKFIRDSHETVKVEQKKANQAELVNLQHENLKQITDEQIKKEKLLESMRSHLDQTRQLTDRELKELEVRTAEEKNKIDTKLSLERERLTSDNEIHLEDIDHRFHSKGKKIQAEGRERLTDLERAQREMYEYREQDFNHKINEQREQFTHKLTTDQRLQQNIKDQQNKQFTTERMSTHRRQNSEVEKMNNGHESYKKLREIEFKRDVGAQESFFERRYSQVRGKHEGDFQRLNELNKKIVNETKKQLANEIQTYTTRSEDPFYQFHELRPTIKEIEGGIEVSVPVPEHSKADLLLTLNNKDVVLNFNRRYVDAHKDASTESRINKVETMTSKVSTGHYLDPKSIKSRYEDGVMTYTIKRA